MIVLKSKHLLNTFLGKNIFFTSNQAIAMILDIKDLASMFNALEEYFQMNK
jgi:hypothetical protein